MFNPNEIFPTKGCAENYTGTWLNDDLGVGQVMNDSGAIQDLLGDLIQGQGTFFVDARRQKTLSTGQALFNYEKDPDNDLELKHLSSGSGDCLVFSSNGNGELTSSGVDCNTKHKPLCFSRPNLLIDEICEYCPQNGPTRCLKWTSLEDYDDSENIKVKKAKICTEPCGALTAGGIENIGRTCEVILSFKGIFLMSHHIFLANGWKYVHPF